MGVIWFICLLGCVVAVDGAGKDPGQATTPVPYDPKQAQFESASVSYEWFDSTRGRTVPVRIHYPSKGGGQFPIIVFSHGLGGSREGYAYLGSRWAARGYIVVHIEHEGSDEDIWRNAKNRRAAMRKAATDWDNVINRSRDVSFVLDQMERLAQSDTLFYGKVAADRIGLGGHSFGAHTALTTLGLGRFYGQPELVDARVDAAVVMSATAGEQSDKLIQSYRLIRTPIMHMTSENDRSPVSGTTPQARHDLFGAITGADQYFVKFARGPHMVFAGPDQEYGAGPKYADVYELIVLSTTSFWDRYLKDDTAAGNWLRVELPTKLERGDTLEVRLKK